MLITNLDRVPGQHVMRSLGLVRGQAPGASHRMASLLSAIRRLLGGELGRYSTLFSLSREKALAHMESQARSMGANAILNVRFFAVPMKRGETNCSVLGTAVVLE